MTFVIGAGCSLDYGMPSGDQLIETILLNLTADNPFKLNIDLNRLKVLQGIVDKAFFDAKLLPNYIELRNKIYYSGVTSIDNFLSQYKEEDFETIVIKYIIYSEIKRLELLSLREGYLKHPDDKNEPELFKFKNNYLRTIFKKKFTKKSLVDLMNHLNDIKYYFVVFNYDRSIEYFLGKAIKNFYNISDQQLLDVFNKNIFFKHVYGTLHNEELNIVQIISDYENGLGNSRGYYIGNFDLVRNIKTIRGENDELYAIRDDYVSKSTRIMILGLGYNEINFRIFPLDHKYVYERELILTTKGMSDGDINKVNITFFGGEEPTGLKPRRDWTAYDLVNHNL